LRVRAVEGIYAIISTRRILTASQFTSDSIINNDDEVVPKINEDDWPSSLPMPRTPTRRAQGQIPIDPKLLDQSPD
jgi:hypothetical protein